MELPFRSWATPKGVPDRPGVNRFAIQVEDHDLSFGDFEGVIAEGKYGAGSISIWDSGSSVGQRGHGRRIGFGNAISREA